MQAVSQVEHRELFSSKIVSEHQVFVQEMHHIGLVVIQSWTHRIDLANSSLPCWVISSILKQLIKAFSRQMLSTIPHLFYIPDSILACKNVLH